MGLNFVKWGHVASLEQQREGGGDVSCFMVGSWWHFCRSMKAEWCCFDGAPRSQGFTFFWPTPFTSFQLHASGENQPLQEISNALLRTRDTFYCGARYFWYHSIEPGSFNIYIPFGRPQFDRIYNRSQELWMLSGATIYWGILAQDSSEVFGVMNLSSGVLS